MILRNPDERTRELERRVRAGDDDAIRPLIGALRRASDPVPYELLGRLFALEHPSDHLVTYPGGRQRRVTNLGWLRRQLHRRGGSLTGNLLPLRFVVRTNVAPFPRECYLRVELSDGTRAGDEAYCVRDPSGAGFLICYHAACYQEATKSIDSPLRGRPIESVRPYLPGVCRACGQQDPFLHTHTFETMFASCEHLWDWLQTPLFENEPLDWDGRIGTIGRRMHESTYGYPLGYRGEGGERGPDAECYVCGRHYWSGDEDADQESVRCPTCYARNRRRNPDEGERRTERSAISSGDLEARARVIMHKVRRGEIPMANVALAAELAGRRDAAMVDPPPYDFEYVNADRRDLVRWALALESRLPGPPRSYMIHYVRGWLDGGKRPPSIGPARAHGVDHGASAIINDASRMIRARSNRALHGLTMRIIESYRVAVYQRFMDELAGHHGENRLSPAWTLMDRRGRPVVKTSGDHHRERQGRRFGQVQGQTISYDPMVMRNASAWQATQVLGRMLLHEE